MATNYVGPTSFQPDVPGPEMRHEPATARRPMLSLVRELAGEGSALVRAEVALAKAEMKENINSVERGVMAMGAGAAVLAVGLLALTAFVILALAEVMAPWAAALIVGAVVTLIGVAMLAIGKKKTSASTLTPDRTLRSLRDDQDLARRESARAKEAWR